MVFLAAAVSDFYLPWSVMSEHKIQSREGPLELSLPQVPKMLLPLKLQWCPDCFVVSFKLETDPSILHAKASKSLAMYNHEVVVANILTTRKETLDLVERGGAIHTLALSKVGVFFCCCLCG